MSKINNFTIFYNKNDQRARLKYVIGQNIIESDKPYILLFEY